MKKNNGGQNIENKYKEELRLMKNKNKFSLQKDEVLDTTAEKSSQLGRVDPMLWKWSQK